MNKDIALCLSGHMRTYALCLDNLRKKILNHNDCDIFIHTWDDNITNWDHVIKEYKPKAICIENNKNFIDKFPQQYETPRGILDNINLISMHYKINQCNKLKLESELFINNNYKYVIRSRPDIVLSKPILVSELHQNNLYVPVLNNNWIDDKFAIASSHIMNIYANTYLYIDEIYTKPFLMHPETVLKEYFDKNKINITTCNTNAGILRTIDEVQDYNFHGPLINFE